MPQFFGALIGFFGSLAIVVKIWIMFIVPLVPAGDYHGLILFGMGVVCFVFFGGLVFAIATACALVFGFLASALTGN